MKKRLGELGLVAASLGACLLFLEFVVCRTLLVPDDLLENVTINQVVRYKPGSRATFRHPDGTSSTVVTNAQGWNSLVSSYEEARARGVQRIAVVGDSYVHGAFVDRHDHFAARLNTFLAERGAKAEVYRFGMDGAPLSQYVHMLRREVLAYKPDIVVIPLIHNDFDESYRFLKTRYASSFMKLERVEGTDEVREIPPTPFKPGLADILRRSAAFRYAYYETGLYLRLKDFVSRYFWGGEEMFDPAFISSGVDVRKIRDHDANRFFARYALGELQKMSRTHGFKLLFVMDGVREAIYAMEPRAQWEVSKLNEIAGEVAGELGLDFVDLQTAFAADYGRNGERFEFAFDWHWNSRGNLIVAEVLERELVTRGWVEVPAGNGDPSAGYACAGEGAGGRVLCQRASAPVSATVR
jgi:hypothetical protein